MDITENASYRELKPVEECQVRTQETFEAVIDTLQDGYFEADPSGAFTYVNQAFANAVGSLSKAELIGKHFRQITTRNSMRSVYKKFKEVFDNQKPVDPFEFVYTNRDGIEYTSEMVVSPILEDGKVIGTRGIVRDVSSRVKADTLMREAKEAAENRTVQLAALNRVAATVSRSLHLNDILNSICKELTTIFPIRNAGVGLLTPDKKYLEIVAFHASGPEEKSALGIFLPYEGNVTSQEVINKKRTLVVQNAQDDPRMGASADILRMRGTKAILIVPLLARGEAIGTIGMPAKDPDYIFTQNEINLAETIASQIASAIDNARLYAKTELALDTAERDLEIGRQIQSGFFPEKLPAIPGWEVATHFHPARQVSGDFYDIFQFKNSKLCAFIIADVCDKGVGAALFMVLFRSLLRAFSEIKVDLEFVQDQLRNIILNTNNFVAQYHGKSNMFATMFFGILDPDSGVLYYVNGGHESPVVLNKEGIPIQRLLPTGPAVGLFPDLEFRVEQYNFNAGDFLVGFTDGSTDARNLTGQHFSEERLLKTITVPWTSLYSMISEINMELKRHIGEQPQYDDITLISFRRRANKNNEIHSICRKASMDYHRELVDFVESSAIYCELSKEDVFAFKLATDELCTNIIQYGYKDREPGLLSVSFVVEDNKASLVILDDGRHFPPDQAKRPDVDADWKEREVGGLGFYFVNQLMDKVTYLRTEDNVNKFILEKEITASKGKKE